MFPTTNAYPLHFPVPTDGIDGKQSCRRLPPPFPRVSRRYRREAELQTLTPSIFPLPPDGIDGKQARRLGMSGPLGELFDHGLDSWSSFFIPITLFSVFGKIEYSIPPVRMFFCMWSVFMCFFLSHWEKYNTGLLFLPWGYDLSQVVSRAEARSMRGPRRGEASVN